MKNFAIVDGVARVFYKTGLKLEKHSPELLMVAGVVGVVAGGIMACAATLKVTEVLNDTKGQLDTIKEVLENPEMEDKYTAEDGKKDTAIVYIQTGVKMAKLYGPAVVLTGASIVCLIGSNRILNRRNVALTAAYSAVANSFKDYRNRVIDRFGKELDRELKYGIRVKEVEEIVVDENGHEKTVKSTLSVIDPNMHSEYARFFDDGCKGWEKDSEFNLMFLRQVQEQANKKLKRQKNLFLNDVYGMLGIPKTQAGQIVGWHYDEENPTGDNFVDFGIYNGHNEKARDFVNGYERTILLDFNVDGPILEYI